jgi:hypothetical protein
MAKNLYFLKVYLQNTISNCLIKNPSPNLSDMNTISKTWIVVFVISCFFVHYQLIAQKKTKVKAHYTLLLEDNDCIGEFKQKVINGAKIKALADKFGTLISQGTDLSVKNKNEAVDTHFQLLQMSEVKGEWIETTQEKLIWELREEKEQQQHLYLTCQIEGFAIEKRHLIPNFEIITSKCESSKECASTVFKEGDNFFVLFKSPTNGYLSIFWKEENEVFRLFPYTTSQLEMGGMKIEENKNYWIFSSKEFHNFPEINPREVDEMNLSTNGKDRLFCELIVVFAEQPFLKPMLSERESDGIKTLTDNELNKWLAKNKLHVDSFQEKRIYITIEK